MNTDFGNDKLSTQAVYDGEEDAVNRNGREVLFPVEGPCVDCRQSLED